MLIEEHDDRRGVVLERSVVVGDVEGKVDIDEALASGTVAVESTVTSTPPSISSSSANATSRPPSAKRRHHLPPPSNPVSINLGTEVGADEIGLWIARSYSLGNEYVVECNSS